jgi:cellulose synthase/poly-beta-1,6-N-acetylglucosamine synthase-like glycosyltransferase
VLLRSSIFKDKDNWFRAEFGSGGEDRDLFRRLIDKGCKFVWCAEAPVYEVVPPERFKRSFMLRRALLRRKPLITTVAAYIKSLFAGSIIHLYSYDLNPGITYL